MMVAFQTGMRRGEVCGLTWDNLDFKEGSLTVDKARLMKEGTYYIGTPKTQSSYRTIGIGDSMIQLLKRHRKQQLKKQVILWTAL